MDPIDFEASYHSIQLTDSKMGLIGTGDITRYISGWPGPDKVEPGEPPKKHVANNFDEYNRVLGALAAKLGVAGPGVLPNVFSFANDPRVDPSEEFYPMTIRRAYEGRASPDEICDTVRIAFLLGKIPFPIGASAYAAKYFGIDCNSFVGNYLGISPYISIAGYAKGYPGTGKISGATTDIYKCRGLLPLAPINDINLIKQGSVLVTFGIADTNGNRWRHIGLVQSFEPVLGAGGARTAGMLSIVEWGQPGGSSGHVVPSSKVDLVTYTCPELPGKTFLAYNSPSTRYGKDAMRLFFDGSKFDSFPTRGWHVCSPDGAMVYDG